MPKKKKFIDKKNAVTFHLVNRSQQDPLQADEDAPKGVLVEASDKVAADVRREQQQKYGVYYDDDYNYLQHLRDVKELNQVEPMEVFRVEPPKNKKKPELMLPSSVFESAMENKVGLLNKGVAVTGPQPTWDPDIVEALDDDFDFENADNQLDDDFIAKAMEDAPVKEGEEDDEGSDDGSFASDEADMMGSDDEFFDEYSNAFANEETRSRFTAYSMTSSVVPRSEALTLVDDRFEKLYEDYDDAEIGALDQEEIEGFVDHSKELLNSVLAEFERDKEQSRITLKDFSGPCGHLEIRDDASDNEDLIKMEVEEKPNKAQWDCESIISTYSNIYNHPKLIEEPKKTRPIKLTKRLGIPEDVLPERGPTLKQREDRDPIEHVPTYRPKDETAEEKKLRKQAIKEERRGRRTEKKAMKQAFKEEEKKQQKELINVRQALQGTHIN